MNWWIAAGVVLALAAGTLLGYWLAGRESSWRTVKLGVFVERSRFDEEELERGWDEQDTIVR